MACWLQGIYFEVIFVNNVVMKKIVIVFMGLVLCGCSVIRVPGDFVYKEIKTNTFNLASWQKINNPNAKYKIYIEGDGYAYDYYGRATENPTPRGKLVREIAFGDKNENVVYLARACQFVSSKMCEKKYWTTARFAPEIIEAQYDAIKQIVGNNRVVLVGFSGGAQIAGLVGVYKQGLVVEKIITIAGNLDHKSWVDYHNLSKFDKSLNLADYYDDFIKIPQVNYVGENDDIVPPFLVKEFIRNDDLVVRIEGATHNSGWNAIKDKVRNE